jgi:hypothetical protein
MMQHFVDLIVQAHRQGVSLASLQLSLTKEGMSSDEIADLLDIVALEVRLPKTITPGKRT